MALWKGKGSTSDIRSYRDITLTEQNSKVAGRSVRNLLIDGVAATAIPTQMGSGFNGGATDVGHLYCKMCFILAHSLRLSAGLIFVDATSAFASLQRRISIPDDGVSEDAWMAHLVWCGFSRQAAVQIMGLAQSAAVWKDAGTAPHASRGARITNSMCLVFGPILHAGCRGCSISDES